MYKYIKDTETKDTQVPEAVKAYKKSVKKEEEEEKQTENQISIEEVEDNKLEEEFFS